MSRSNTNSNPKPQSDHGSAAAPGVRTEDEVLADEQDAREQAAASAETPGAGVPDSDVPDEVNEDKLVHYLRESDGTVQSVNEGSIAHAALVRDPEFEETTRAKALAAAKSNARSFTRAATK